MGFAAWGAAADGEATDVAVADGVAANTTGDGVANWPVVLFTPGGEIAEAGEACE